MCYRTTHTIQDRAWQMERWVEHYSELYAIQKEYGVWAKKPWTLQSAYQ